MKYVNPCRRQHAQPKMSGGSQKMSGPSLHRSKSIAIDVSEGDEHLGRQVKFEPAQTVSILGEITGDVLVRRRLDPFRRGVVRHRIARRQVSRIPNVRDVPGADDFGVYAIAV